eukprot:jgi/Ulvmu1/7625/UM038_0051.1
MGLNVFIIQYPASVKISTIARKRADNKKTTDGTWKGLLQERLDNLGLETPSIANGKLSSSPRAEGDAQSRDKADGDGGDSFDVVVEAPDEVPDLQEEEQQPASSEAAEQSDGPQEGPTFISAARDAVASVLQISPFGQSAEGEGGGEGSQPEATSKPIEEVAEQNLSASRERRMQTTGSKNLSERQTDDCGKMVYKARSSSVKSDDDEPVDQPMASGQEHPAVGEDKEEAPNTELDVDGMIRKEIAWLKADGYLAGQASFFQSISEQSVLVTFPCDDAHSAFITTVIEGVGIGSDFGSVVVLPVSGGMAAYRHQGWNNPEARHAAKQKSPDPSDEPTWLSFCWARKKKRPASGMEDTHELSSEGKKADRDSDSGHAKDGPCKDGQAMEERTNDTEEEERQKARKDRYMNAASKLRVDQVIEQTKTNATLDFDYLAYLVISAVLAAVGLGTNSAPIIVASMLVAPLMGPIMAMSLAINLRRWKLAWLGAWNFATSLGIAIGIGFVGGLCGIPFISNEDDWPTFEMKSRSGSTTLLVGLVIAIFSGGGVALSILSDNSSSLVGVAISAALLPPAVNTGLCWAVAAAQESVHTTWSHDNKRWVILGSHSLALVMLNSVCVALSASVMFRVKQVVPKGRRVVFWREDLKAAQASKGKEGHQD